ncbi:PAP2 superfamily protein [Actinoplanes teichomyceticus]|uniref:PAP2 superfamily protein n=2 Tax=Actinoplanes teichomyceticus TaxID=1867 RepID=A0A561WSB5_ACTTI|nr:PAP2 superfamily protein [Actinoplanes teichomyceticus]GIF15142.1 phosphatidic acid phosphatase [Actinoplanes teichomyceticus]
MTDHVVADAAEPPARVDQEHERTAPELDRKAPAGRRRTLAMGCWVALFVAAVLSWGLPTDPVYAFLWLWALAVAWRFGRPWREHLAFARDWVPVVLLLTLYNLSRGFADNIRTPHVTEMIDADRWMFGWMTGGEVPTVWLQQRLYVPDDVQWWEALVSMVYLSHFVASLGTAIVLWLVARHRWAQFMRRWFVLGLAGLATYFVYPAAPPWWAAVNGYLDHSVPRLSLRGGQELGMHGAFSIVKLGQAAANPVAAMPSLHTAYALMVVLFFALMVRKRWWPLLALYPLAMTFTLVYSGEHYVIDVLVGWAYVVFAFTVVWLGERWWRERRARTAADGTPVRAEQREPSADGSVRTSV